MLFISNWTLGEVVLLYLQLHYLYFHQMMIAGDLHLHLQGLLVMQYALLGYLKFLQFYHQFILQLQHQLNVI